MNAYAFLLMLAVFGAVAYWYILNLESGSDGEEGLLGLKPDADTPVGSLKQRLAGQRRRGAKGAHGALDRVRDKAGKPEETDPDKLERQMKAEISVLEDNRRHYADPRTGSVRDHVDAGDRKKARSPYQSERGAVVDPEEHRETVRSRLREARLQSDSQARTPRPRSGDRPKRYRLKDDKPPKH